jgi:Predicted Zn-dependent proteases and their inactivated homologs
MAKITDSLTKILFYNSNGECFTDIRPMINVITNCVMQDGDRSESGGCSRSYRIGFEFLTKELVEEIANETVEKTSFLFSASQPKGGQMAVVMGAGASGILLHEAVGHTFEADFNRKGTSIFSDMMGKQVCNTNISIVDDGTIKNNRGSCNFDDEGIKGQKTYMVKDGILNSYLHDRISAKVL